MNVKEIFNQAVKDIKQDEFYIPRDYKTIGGIWTVDTWQKNNIRVQVMDEGYTTKLSLIDNEKVVWSIVDSVRRFELNEIEEKDFINYFSAPKKKIKPN